MTFLSFLLVDDVVVNMWKAKFDNFLIKASHTTMI